MKSLLTFAAGFTAAVMVSASDPPQPSVEEEADIRLQEFVKAYRKPATEGFVNGRFDALAAEIDALKDRVNSLETVVLSRRSPPPIPLANDVGFETHQQTRVMQEMLRQQQMEEIRRRKPNGWPDNVPYPR